MSAKRSLVAHGLALVLLGGVVACNPEPEPGRTGAQTVPEWMNVELTDVRSGEAFRISDFRGKPVLVESFAVWCPTCTAQQRETGRLKDLEGERIVHISLDTDPNEDEARIAEHLDRNGFDWYYAVSPIELTQALIDRFGLTVVNAPQAPMILVCEDQSARLLRNGVKSAQDLLAEVEKGCN